jgi:trypsin
MTKAILILALAVIPGMTNAADMVNFDNPAVNDLAAAMTGVAVPIPATSLSAENRERISFAFPKIVGGVEAAREEFPFIVSLQTSYSRHFCGGSLIRKNWVLTAAHCVESGSLPTVVIGLHDLTSTTGAEKFSAAQVIKHPNWNRGTMDYDFALIRLEGESKYPVVALNSQELSAPVDFLTAGWGTTSEGGSPSDTLLKVMVPLVAKAECDIAYPGKITDRMVCAGYEDGGKDSCQGDSGGPLVMGTGSNMYLAGVVSWGYGCAQPKKYGIYSKVNSAVSWINSTVQ